MEVLGKEDTPINNSISILKSEDLKQFTVDSAYNIHGYKVQSVIAAAKIMSQNPH